MATPACWIRPLDSELIASHLQTGLMVEVAWCSCGCLLAQAALPQLLCRPGGGQRPGTPETWAPAPPPPLALRMRALQQQQHAHGAALQHTCCNVYVESRARRRPAAASQMPDLQSVAMSRHSMECGTRCSVWTTPMHCSQRVHCMDGARTCSICWRGRCSRRSPLLSLRLHIVQGRRKIYLTVSFDH